MTAEVDFATEQWWRFDRYELRDGVIRPAVGAALEVYDPWREYRHRRSQEGVGPYQDLLNLAGSLKLDAYKVFTSSDLQQHEPGVDLLASDTFSGTVLKGLDAAGEQALLTWCSRYGLLGCLPNRVLSMTLPARWEAGPASPETLLPTVTRFVPSPHGWSIARQQSIMLSPSSQHRGILTSYPKHEYQHTGRLVDEPDILSSLDRPGVFFREGNGRVVHGSLSEIVAPYFPDAYGKDLETYPYPRPLSAKFMSEYAEPLALFWQSAADFIQAVEAMRFGSSPGPWPMQGLIASVSPTLVLGEEGQFHQEWRCGSLLASLAMMVVMDVSEGSRIDRCATCRGYFSSRSPQALYCSVRCRQTEQKRAYRRRRLERQQSSAGEPEGNDIHA